MLLWMKSEKQPLYPAWGQRLSGDERRRLLPAELLHGVAHKGIVFALKVQGCDAVVAGVDVVVALNDRQTSQGDHHILGAAAGEIGTAAAAAAQGVPSEQVVANGQGDTARGVAGGV